MIWTPAIVKPTATSNMRVRWLFLAFGGFKTYMDALIRAIAYPMNCFEWMIEKKISNSLISFIVKLIEEHTIGSSHESRIIKFRGNNTEGNGNITEEIKTRFFWFSSSRFYCLSRYFFM